MRGYPLYAKKVFTETLREHRYWPDGKAAICEAACCGCGKPFLSGNAPLDHEMWRAHVAEQLAARVDAAYHAIKLLRQVVSAQAYLDNARLDFVSDMDGPALDVADEGVTDAHERAKAWLHALERDPFRDALLDPTEGRVISGIDKDTET